MPPFTLTFTVMVEEDDDEDDEKQQLAPPSKAFVEYRRGTSDSEDAIVPPRAMYTSISPNAMFSPALSSGRAAAVAATLAPALATATNGTENKEETKSR